MAALHSRCRHYIFAQFLFFLSFFPFFFSSPNLSGHRLDVYHTSTHGVVLMRVFTMQVWNVLHGSLKVQDAAIRHLCTVVQQLCRAVSSQLRHISTVAKKMLNSNASSTCPHNMVNFGPLTAEIGSGVWVSLRISAGFAYWQRLLHGTLIVGVSQSAALNMAPPIFDRAAITLGIGPHSGS